MYSKVIVWQKTKQKINAKNKNPQQVNMFVIYIKDKIPLSRLCKQFLEAKKKKKYNRTSGKGLQQFFT